MGPAKRHGSMRRLSGGSAERSDQPGYFIPERLRPGLWPPAGPGEDVRR